MSLGMWPRCSSSGTAAQRKREEIAAMVSKSTVLALVVLSSLFGAGRANAQGLGVYGNGQLALTGSTNEQTRDFSATARFELEVVVGDKGIWTPFKGSSPEPHIKRIPGVQLAFFGTAATTHPSGEKKLDRKGRVVLDKNQSPVSNIRVVSAGIFGRLKSVELFNTESKEFTPNVELDELPSGAYNFLAKVALPMTRKDRKTYVPVASEISSWLGIFPNAFTKVRNDEGIIIVEQPFTLGDYDGPDPKWVITSGELWMFWFCNCLGSGANINGLLGTFAGTGNLLVAAPYTTELARALYDEAMYEHCARNHDLIDGLKVRQLQKQKAADEKARAEAEARAKEEALKLEPLVVTAGEDSETNVPVWELSARADLSIVILNRKGKERPIEMQANTTTTVSKTFIGYIVTRKVDGTKFIFCADGTPTTDEALRAKIQR